MRPEKLYLTDIVEAGISIANFCANVTYDQFAADDMRRSAVLQKLIIIGEAAAHLSEEFCLSHTSVEWVDIVGFRNIAVHEYFAVKWDIVWFTAMDDVPFLCAQVEKILRDEFSNETD
jgi:uncharacterized protein with HEPN domain